MEQTVRTASEGDAPHLRLVGEPGLDERIETLVDVLWQRGALMVPELTEALGWEAALVSEVLAESEKLGVLQRIRADPHDIVDLG